MSKQEIYKDIVEIESGKIDNNNGEERNFAPKWRVDYYRERLFFNCYADLLPVIAVEG